MNDCDAPRPTPLVAEIVKRYVPRRRTLPESVAVPSRFAVNRTPEGKLFELLIVGVGEPVEVNVNVNDWPAGTA